jgi:hypothetical protein
MSKEKRKDNERLRENLINIESYNILYSFISKLSSPEFLSCSKKIGKILTEFII